MPAPDHFLRAIYSELRTSAARRLGRGQGLEPTELVHEAYMRLEDHSFEGLTHFRAVASVAMRQVIIDHVRQRNALKRGGGQRHITLTDIGVAPLDEQILDLDRALARLEGLDPRKGKLIEMRLFGGMELQEIACEMGLSLSTVKRDWRTARAFVLSELS